MASVREAPVFWPSEEEFNNPLRYIESIRKEAEAAGICKIVPPSTWRSPFAVDEEQFRFHTRLQTVTKVDGVARIEREFMYRVRKFLFLKGTPMEKTSLPVLPEPGGGGHPLRLYRLFSTVEALGGVLCVVAQENWSAVVEALAPHVEAHDDKLELAKKLKEVYWRHLLSFGLELANSKEDHEQRSTDHEGYISQASAVPSCDNLTCPSMDAPIEHLMFSAVEGASWGVNGAILGRQRDDYSKRSVEMGQSEAKAASSPEMTHRETEMRFYETKSLHVVERKKRGRPPSEETLRRKKILNTRTFKVRRERLSQDISKRSLPEVSLGATFFKYYADIDKCFVGRVLYYDKASELYHVEYSPSPTENILSHTEELNEENLVMLLASGESEELAREALVKGICQECLRADRADEMLLCDGCNFSYHINCHRPSLLHVPRGDWFCSMCLDPEEEDEDADDEDDDATIKTPFSASVPKEAETKGKEEGGDPIRLSRAFRKSLAAFGFGEGDEYTIHEYREMATAFKKRYLEEIQQRRGSEVPNFTKLHGTEKGDLALEQEYWRLVSEEARGNAKLVDVKVSYGSDLDTGALGSGFPTEATVARMRKQLESLQGGRGGYNAYHKRRRMDQSIAVETPLSEKDIECDELYAKIQLYEKYAKSGWNLNNFPKLPGSLLQFVDENITGVIIPWLYFGMMFSSFCWHTEDHYFASINYHHWGEPKTWYGVPSSGADAFEQAAQKIAPELFIARPDILSGIVTQFNPVELARHGAPVHHLIQRPGDIVLTFPRAYHGGFNHGLNCAEAVNFATMHWLKFANPCAHRYMTLRKNPVISTEAFLGSLVDTALQTRSVGLSQHLVGMLADLVSEEKKWREELMATGHLQEEAFSISLKLEAESGLPPPSNGSSMSRMGNSAMSRLGNTSMSRMIGAAGNSSGRERAHGTRIGKGSAEDEAKRWTNQVQCAECRKFCSLSYAKVTRANGSVENICLNHASSFMSEIKLSGSRISLVTIIPMEKLEFLLEELKALAFGIAQWRKVVHGVLIDQCDPDQVEGLSLASDPCTLSKQALALSLSHESDPAKEGLPPGALHSLHVALEQKLPLHAAKVEKVLHLASSFGLQPNCPEVAKLEQAVATSLQKLRIAQKFIASCRPDLSPKQWASATDLEGFCAENEGKCFGFKDEMDRIRELVSKFQDWKRRVNNVARTDDSQELEALTSLANEMLAAVCVKSSLHQTIKSRCIVLDWALRAEKIIETQADLAVAENHLNTWKAPSDPASSTSIIELHRMFSEGVRTGKDWLGRATIAMHHMRTDDFRSLAEVARNLPFKPQEAVDELGRLVSKVDSFEQSVRSELVPGQNGTLRCKEGAVSKLLEQGDQLQLTTSNNNVMGDLFRSKAIGMEWRESVTRNVVHFQVATENDAGLARAQTSSLLVDLFLVSLQDIDPQLLPGDGTNTLMQGPNGLWKPPFASAEECVRACSYNQNHERLYCVCRKPEIKGTFMIACDTCDEWFHPRCLASTEQQMKELGTFHCATCIYDGKVQRPPRKEGLYCYCTQTFSQECTMVECETCKDWFHPLCVGITELDAHKIDHYHCPDCKLKADQRPIVKLFCLCRKPDFGTTLYNESMVSCDKCEDWFHNSCLGFTVDQVSELLSKNESFYCARCCDTYDVPFEKETCKNGFFFAHTKLKKHRSLAKDRVKVLYTDQNTLAVASMIVRMTLENAEAHLRTLESLPIALPEEDVLRTLLKVTQSWVNAVTAVDLRNTGTRVLWNYLFQEAVLPLEVPEVITNQILHVLWTRKLTALWCAESALEKFPMEIPQNLNANVLPAMAKRGAFSQMGAFLSSRSFRQIVDTELNNGSIEAQMQRTFVFEFDKQRLAQNWERRCRNILKKLNTSTEQSKLWEKVMALFNELQSIDVPKNSSVRTALESYIVSRHM